MRGQKSSILLGRRTKTDVLKDKVVRKDDDGQDCFEDYWTDSDNESTVFSRSNWTLKSDSSKANLQDSDVTNQSLRRSLRIIESSQKEFPTVSSSQPGDTSRSGSSKTNDVSSKEKEFQEPSQLVKSAGLFNEISRVLRSESKNKSQNNLSLGDKKIHSKSVVIPAKTSNRKNVSSAGLSKNSLSHRETNINKLNHSTSAHSRPENEASLHNGLPPNAKSLFSETENLASTNAKRQVEPSMSKGSLIITPAKTTYTIDETHAELPKKSVRVPNSKQSRHSSSSQLRPENEVSSIALHSDSGSLFSKSALVSKHSNHQVGASIPDNSIRAAGTSSVKTVADYSLKGKHLSGNSKEVGANVCEIERSNRKEGLSQRVADQAENHFVELPEKKTRKRKLPKSVEKPTVAERPVRNRRPPLAHWRNERVLYRYENGEIKCLGVQEGTTEDKGAINALLKISKKKKKESGKRRIKGITGSIYDAERDKKVTVKLVTPFHSVPWDVTSPSKPYRLKKMLNTGTVSFGYFEIQGLETKDTQYMPTEDLHMIVIQGRVQFLIQENKIEVGEKDMVIVPRCVAYSITNLENRKALLYFSVGRFKYLESCGVT